VTQSKEYFKTTMQFGMLSYSVY